MKWQDLFESWSITKVSLDFKFAQLEFDPNPEDEEAAWEMYVELITRVTTQYLSPEHGDEKAALDSVYKLFDITRFILKERGRKCKEFTRIAVIVLNQIIRPFTAKWHKLSLQKAFEFPEKCEEFRSELGALQNDLRNYARLLANIAKVEDLSDIADL